MDITLTSFIPIILLFIFFFMKIPVAHAMLLSTLPYFIFINTDVPVEFVVQRMIASMESFSYLAIPFFACAGVVFNYAGITRRLIDLAELLVGHMRGGLGQVNVLVSAMMGGLSGSACADAAMESKIIVPQMTRLGYGKGFSLCVTAASSCITPIIPPGIILILYAAAADVSIARMFFAGFVPGIIMTIALMLLVAWISRRKNYAPSRESRASFKEIWRQLIKSMWALFLPFGILLGLRIGMFTPTEAGAMSVLYALLVGFFIYRELKIKDLPKVLLESIEATAGVMVIIAAANAFGTYLTWERIPIIVSEVMVNNINNPYLMLLVINIGLLMVGCFFDGGAAMVLMAPILVPAVSAMGIDLIHFGIIMAINLTLSGITPPFGTMMFVTTSVTNTKLEEYIRNCAPFIAVLVGVLLLLTYIPQIVTFIPDLLL
jgi:tripartite ATP-independent transporter DctM subunit